MSLVQAGEVRLDADVLGATGDWVLMIHGLGYGRWGWNWNAPALAARFRVVTFDNRGVGGSDAPAGPYSAALMAGDALRLLDALGIERAHVVGTSLGGFIAQELALAAPDRVGRLVLACSGFGGPRYAPMPDVTVRLMAEAPSLPDEARLRRFIENGFTTGFVAANPRVIEEVMRLRKETAQPLEHWNYQAYAGATFDAGDRVGDIAAETLVITGSADNVVDPKNSVLLTDSIPGAALVEMDGGHLFFIEQAPRFNQTVAAFLEHGASAIG